MIAAWMCFAIVIGACFAAAALAAERVSVALGRPVRLVWVTAIVTMIAWPVIALMHASSAGSSPGTGALIAPITIGVQQMTAFVVGSSTSHRARVLDAVLLASWGTLSVVCLANLARTMRALARQRRAWRAQQVDGTVVRLSPDIGPAVVGLNPMEIVLPEWTLALDHPLRALVLRHEEEHRRARDPFVLFASALLVALMPWNIALWWCVRRLRLAIELDCDARVLRAHPRVERYGLLLLTIAQRHSAAATRFAPALSEPSSNLERRIIAMRRTVARISRVRVLLLGAAAAAAIAVACSVPAPDNATEPGTADASGLGIPAGRVNGADGGMPLNADQTYFSFQVEKPALAYSDNAKPVYPSMLESAHVDGEVLVQFVVDTTGRVDMSTFKVLKATNDLFVDAIRAVAGSWRFTPAEAGGHPVKQLVQLPLVFKTQ